LLGKKGYVVVVVVYIFTTLPIFKRKLMPLLYQAWSG